MPLPAFSQSLQQELDADKQAILLLQKDDQHRSDVFNAALIWFGCLELYEAVADFMYPTNPYAPSSHPSARQRFEHLLTSFPSSNEQDESCWKPFLESIDFLKEIVLEDVSVNTELYEFYGSVYLDKPDSEWRGPELIDRKDYY